MVHKLVFRSLKNFAYHSCLDLILIISVLYLFELNLFGVMAIIGVNFMFFVPVKFIQQLKIFQLSFQLQILDI